MNKCGTIDEAGFRADLAAIATNDYPPLALVKLPFNWWVPSYGGIAQTVGGGNPGVILPSGGVVVPNTQAGNALIVFVATEAGPTIPAGTELQCGDSQGNTYSQIGWTGQAFAGCTTYVFIAQNIVGGSTTVNTSSVTYPGQRVIGQIVYEVSGVTALRSSSGGLNATGPAACVVGDLALSFAAHPPSTGTWTEDSGWTLALNISANNTVGYSSYQKITASGSAQNHMVDTTWGGNPSDNYIVVLQGNFTANLQRIPAPITSIPLPGPCNFIALVSEAIDEQGNHVTSALIGQQAAAGFLRLNGQGNVWFPVSFADPLMPGYVTTTNNYALNPIAGTGFSAIEAPFGTLDWQPASPSQYAILPINYFNPANFIQDTLVVYTNGVVSPASPPNTYFTNKIDLGILPPTNIVCNFDMESVAGFGPCWYDATDTYMSGLSTTTTAGTALSVPAGGRYFCSWFRNAIVEPNQIMILGGATVPSVYVPFGQISSPPNYADGYMLAFVGMSVGAGAATGAGNASTYAIPSASGPVSRLKGVL